MASLQTTPGPRPNGKRALIITGPGVEDAEFLYPYYRLVEAGFHVDVATKDAAEVKGKHGVPIKANVDAATIPDTEYDLVLVPGGHEAPDRVRQIPRVLSFVKQMHDKGKVIAAVCHGPQVLISAGILRGRRVTCYPGCKDDVINAGAKYEATPVVVDGNLVTSPHFRDMAPWMAAVIKACGAT